MTASFVTAFTVLSVLRGNSCQPEEVTNHINQAAGVPLQSRSGHLPLACMNPVHCHQHCAHLDGCCNLCQRVQYAAERAQVCPKPAAGKAPPDIVLHSQVGPISFRIPIASGAVCTPGQGLAGPWPSARTVQKARGIRDLTRPICKPRD